MRSGASTKLSNLTFDSQQCQRKQRLKKAHFMEPGNYYRLPLAPVPDCTFRKISASIIFNKAASVDYSGHDFSPHFAWLGGRCTFRDRRHRWRHHDCPGTGLFLPYEPTQSPGDIACRAAGAGWSIGFLGVLQGRKCQPESWSAHRYGLSYWRLFRWIVGPAPV